jgi:hypothetical protein
MKENNIFYKIRGAIFNDYNVQGSDLRESACKLEGRNNLAGHFTLRKSACSAGE